MADTALTDAAASISTSPARTAEIHAFFDEDTFTVTYVVSDPDTKQAAIVRAY